MSGLDAILEELFQAAPAGHGGGDVESWWRGHRALSARYDAPIEVAIAGGVAAERPAFAFASGYQAALIRLVPSARGRRISLCATEEGGAHPRAIRTSLVSKGRGWRLSGHKRWLTLGTLADELLILASEGTGSDGKSRLAAVRIPADRTGVRVAEMPPAPFVPEIPHAELSLDEVRVEPHERLPGDGYADYLKPFRTVEDIHVFAALLAWLFGVGRRATWPREPLAELLALLAAAHGLAAADPKSAQVHVAVGGMLGQARALIGRLAPHWDAVDDTIRALWQRDRALLEVAERARSRRLAVAWERLGRE